MASPHLHDDGTGPTLYSSVRWDKALTVLAPTKAPVTIKNLSFITRFEPGHGWTASDSPTADLNNTEQMVKSGQSVKLTAATLTAVAVEKTGLAVDFTGKTIVVFFRVADANNNGFTLYVGDSTFTNYYLFSVVAGLVVPEDGWVCMKLNFSQATVIGTPNRAAIARIKVRQNTPLAAPASSWIGAVATAPEPTVYPNGVMTFSFDDSHASTYAYARAKLDQYGFSADAYVIGDTSDAAGSTGMSVQNLHVLEQVSGWEVGGHAAKLNLHVDMTKLSVGDAERALVDLKAWLVSRGFRGDHYAYPFGANNAAVRALVAKLFMTGRTVVGGGYPNVTPPPTENLMRLRAAPWDSPGWTTTAQVTTAMDKAKANKMWFPLCLHNIVPSAPASGDITQADFNIIVDYANTIGIAVRTIGQVLRSE